MSDDKKHVTLVEFTKKAAEPNFDAAGAVEELLRRIQRGEINPTKIVMFIIEGDAARNWLPQIWRANTEMIEALAIVELCKAEIIQEIKGDT